MMLKIQLSQLFLATLFAIITVYGAWNVLIEAARTILPFGILLVLFLTSMVHFLRVPAPTAETVEALLGKEPHLAEENDVGVIKTVAHRGASLDAPENSLEAFKMCSEKGCNTIEFDVKLTSDGVPIVFHDHNLERMTDANLIVRESKWAQLSNVDISVKHPFKDRFAKTNIPTLEQTVQQLLTAGQRMFIDLKDNDYKLIQVVLELFQRHPDLYSRAVVSSFYPNLIYMIRRGDPKIVCSLAWRPYMFAYTAYTYPDGCGDRWAKSWYKHWFLTMCDGLHTWALPRVTYYLLGLSVILLHKEALSSKAVLDWRERGVRVMAWTVNSPTEKQYITRVLKITYLTDTLTGEASTHWVHQ